MSGLLSEITRMWAEITFERSINYQAPTYFSLPQEIRDDLESGEKNRVRKGFQAIIQGKVPITQATLKYIEERFDPNLKK